MVGPNPLMMIIEGLCAGFSDGGVRVGLVEWLGEDGLP